MRHFENRRRTRSGNVKKEIRLTDAPEANDDDK